jgi:hypothetical protein
MPVFARRRFVALTLAASLAACAGQQDVRPGSRLIVLRHADRAAENLSDEGRARAQGLVPTLAAYPIDAIYAPDIARNLDTARPLATARELEVQVISTTGVAARLAAAHPGGTAVWIGNKDNLRRIWQELGAPGAPPLEYGEIAIVETTDGPPRIQRLYSGL